MYIVILVIVFASIVAGNDDNEPILVPLIKMINPEGIGAARDSLYHESTYKLASKGIRDLIHSARIHGEVENDVPPAIITVDPGNNVDVDFEGYSNGIASLSAWLHFNRGGEEENMGILRQVEYDILLTSSTTLLYIPAFIYTHPIGPERRIVIAEMDGPGSYSLAAYPQYDYRTETSDATFTIGKIGWFIHMSSSDSTKLIGMVQEVYGTGAHIINMKKRERYAFDMFGGGIW